MAYVTIANGYQPGGVTAYYEPLLGGWRFGETDYQTQCGIISTSTNCDPAEPRTIAHPKGSLVFEDVHFRYQDAQREFERHCIACVVRTCEGNLGKAASALGITSTVRRGVRATGRLTMN